MEEILLIAPYPKLAEVAEHLLKKTDAKFSLTKSYSEATYHELINEITSETRLVISRGGTAQYLKGLIDFPIVEITVTIFDVLKAISFVSKQGYKRIIIITPSNIIPKTDQWIEFQENLMLQFEICEDAALIPARVKWLIENKPVEAIIGDRVATRIAEQSGVYGHLLESGEESLLIALDIATSILKANNQEKAKLKEMESILKSFI